MVDRNDGPPGGAPAAPADGARRGIFRAEALERYVHRGEDQVLPPLTNPTVFILLWVLLGLLGTALALVASVKVVTYTSAIGVVGPGEDGLVLLVEPDEASRLAPGAAVVVAEGKAAGRRAGTVAGRVPGVLSPAEAVRRFQLTGPAACAVSQPVVAALVTLDAVPLELRPPGALLSLRVETGGERLLSQLGSRGGRSRG